MALEYLQLHLLARVNQIKCMLDVVMFAALAALMVLSVVVALLPEDEEDEERLLEL